jgi:hypothetical protein
MVTAQIPWKRTTLKEQVAYLCRGEFQVPKYLTKECKKLIKSMLIVSQTDRATVEEIKQHPWLSLYQA